MSLRLRIGAVVLAMGLLTAHTLPAQTARADVRAISLQTARGTIFSLDRIQSNKATVFVFFSPECPICNHFTLKLDTIYRAYASKGVAFYLVYTDRDMNGDTIKRHADAHRLKYGLLLDTDRKLTNALNARITPEAFVLSRTGKTLYRGRIDDYYVGLGRYRTTGPTTNELSNAIAAAITGKTVAVRETKPIGCYITRVLPTTN